MADNNKATVVTYDVSQAVAAVERLADTINGASQRIVDAFEKSESASKKVNTGLGDVHGAANDLSGGLLGVAADAGVLVGAFIGAATGAAKLTEQLAVQTFGFEQVAEQVQDVIERTENLRAINQGVKDIGDSARNTQLERQLFLLGRTQQAEVRAQQRALADEQQVLGNRLSAARAFYSNLEQLADKSAQKRQQAEDKLADLVQRTNERRFLSSISRFGDNAQVSKIIQQAESLQKQGGSKNLDAAQSLLDKALGKADGNAVSVRRVEEAINGLITARSNEAAAAERQAQADQKNAAAAKAEIKAIDEKTQATQRLQRVLANDITQKAVARADKQRDLKIDRDEQEFIRATAAAQAKLTQLQGSGQVTPAARAIATAQHPLNTLSSLLIPDAEIDKQRTIIDKAEALQDKITRALSKNPTPAGAQQQKPAFDSLSKLISQLNDAPNKNSAFSPDLAKLNQARELIKGYLADLNEAARASGKLDGTGPDRLTPIRANPALPSQNTNPAAAGPPARAQQNLNVNVQVRGGMVDAETAQQLADIVARQIRKGTQ